MYKIDFGKPIHIHFIGIGGISMSGLAEILHEESFTISGSDSKESDLTKTLAAKGIKVIYGQSADNITSGIDLVVYTAAMCCTVAVLYSSSRETDEIPFRVPEPETPATTPARSVLSCREVHHSAPWMP